MKAFNKKKFIALSILSFSVHSKDLIVGNTYDIEEKDAEIELMEKVDNINWENEIKKRNDPSGWAASQTVTLPMVEITQTRSYVPFYKSEFEIKDLKGKVIYPKGYTFNPLQFVRMPNKLYILSPTTSKYFVGKISNRDQVIIANGNPLDQREVFNSPVFSLDEKTKERLGIEKVPSIVWQEGALLKIKEISIRDLENENID